MKHRPESLREGIDRVFADTAGGYVPSYLLRLVALSLMVGALAFEALYRFGGVFEGGSLLLIVIAILAFGCGAVFAALLIGYQVSERNEPVVRRVHDRSW